MVIRKERFSAIATRASLLSGAGGPVLGLLAGPAEPGHSVSGHSAREGSEALEVARARNPVGRRSLLPVGGGACRGDGCRLCQSSVAHRRGGFTATLPRRKHSRAVRLVDVAHRVALLASDYSGSAQRTRARCSCSGHVRDQRSGGATEAAIFHSATSAPPGADRTGLGKLRLVRWNVGPSRPDGSRPAMSSRCQPARTASGSPAATRAWKVVRW